MAQRRSTEQWLNYQAKRGQTKENGGVRELFICQLGLTMEGWINTVTGQRIITCLRRATAGDDIRKGVHRLGRKLGLMQRDPTARLTGIVDANGRPIGGMI